MFQDAWVHMFHDVNNQGTWSPGFSTIEATFLGHHVIFVILKNHTQMAWDQVRTSVVLDSSKIGCKGNCPRACQGPLYGTSSADGMSGIGWVLIPLNSSAQSAIANTWQARSALSSGSKNRRDLTFWSYWLACRLREVYRSLILSCRWLTTLSFHASYHLQATCSSLSRKAGLLDTGFFFQDSSSPVYQEAAAGPKLAISQSFSVMVRPLPLPQEVSSAGAGLVQGLVLLPEGAPPEPVFPGVWPQISESAWVLLEHHQLPVSVPVSRWTVLKVPFY